MEYVNQLLQNERYLSELEKIERLEGIRPYCLHDMEHFLAVARLMWIYNLEEGRKLEKEVIYLTALLHDIGRAAEYEKGISHDRASAGLSREILSILGVDREKSERIIAAILSHRQEGAREQEQEILDKLLYRADKESRNCFICRARESCKWPGELKNKNIKA